MDALSLALVVAIAAPGLCSVVLAVAVLVRDDLSEWAISRAVSVALVASLVANVFAVILGATRHQEIDYGAWIAASDYTVPAVLIVDEVALAFAVLAAGATALVARLSHTYMHNEPGFLRYFLLLGMFATGTQLVAYAGGLDVFFAGWEMMGISSALYIGFFHQRAEPVRSSLRAFATYRLCDVGFMLGVVLTHEWIGSTRLSALPAMHGLPPASAFLIAALFLLSAAGKSAQLPFSGWLARAMEGPTSSSALFYGGISIHAGLFLLLRIRPVLAAAPGVEAFGVALGLTTAVYAAVVARTQADAKGALAHATLGQVGLILAEICLGLDTLALVHLVGHAVLRLYQYLRAPNRIHDAHRLGPAPTRAAAAPSAWSIRLYAAGLYRLRLDERLDLALAPVFAGARALSALDGRARRLLTLDGGKP